MSAGQIYEHTVHRRFGSVPVPALALVAVLGITSEAAATLRSHHPSPQVSRPNREVKRLERRLDNMTIARAQAKAALATAQGQIASLQGQVASLQGQVGSLQASLAQRNARDPLRPSTGTT